MSPQTSAHVGPCYFKSARKVTTFIPFLQIFIGKLMSSFFKRVTRRAVGLFLIIGLPVVIRRIPDLTCQVR